MSCPLVTSYPLAILSPCPRHVTFSLILFKCVMFTYCLILCCPFRSCYILVYFLFLSWPLILCHLSSSLFASLLLPHILWLCSCVLFEFSFCLFPLSHRLFCLLLSVTFICFVLSCPSSSVHSSSIWLCLGLLSFVLFCHLLSCHFLFFFPLSWQREMRQSLVLISSLPLYCVVMFSDSSEETPKQQDPSTLNMHLVYES